MHVHLNHTRFLNEYFNTNPDDECQTAESLYNPGNVWKGLRRHHQIATKAMFLQLYEDHSAKTTQFYKNKENYPTKYSEQFFPSQDFIAVFSWSLL